jgi:hypothetical protein
MEADVAQEPPQARAQPGSRRESEVPTNDSRPGTRLDVGAHALRIPGRRRPGAYKSPIRNPDGPVRWERWRSCSAPCSAEHCLSPSHWGRESMVRTALRCPRFAPHGYTGPLFEKFGLGEGTELLAESKRYTDVVYATDGVKGDLRIDPPSSAPVPRGATAMLARGGAPGLEAACGFPYIGEASANPSGPITGFTSTCESPFPSYRPRVVTSSRSQYSTCSFPSGPSETSHGAWPAHKARASLSGSLSSCFRTMRPPRPCRSCCRMTGPFA